MKIIFFYNEEWEREYFGSRIGVDFEIKFVKGVVQEHPELKDEEAEVLCVFVGSRVDKEAMDRFPKLKLIATRSTGFDHIDIEEARRRNIAVSNVPAYGSATVAEFAFALLLALSRKIFPAYEQVLRKGSFSKEGLRGFDLAGKTLGVLGVGKIGRHLIKIARGFEMNVLAFDTNPDEQFSQKMGFEYVDFETLLRQADIISLHLPYNSRTHHILNGEAFSKMKKGVYIINTSRGGVIETETLVKALRDGVVAGAGLDVLEAEIYMGDELKLLKEKQSKAKDIETVLNNQYLIDHPNVIITPHNAFNTQEALERIFRTTAKNIKYFAEGEVKNKVM
ncbi:MAG: hydroxyacid dehydrogenase [Candidatus Pacebacteria bacterium]|nr:hydroxyacid dehydrogenase [Candidatus Paceibacterota bacterium]